MDSFLKEKQLLALLKKGDEKAFDAIFNKYASNLFWFSFEMLKDKVEAEEIVQDTFVKLWETRNRINPDQTFGTYLNSIAKYTIYNQIKHKYVAKKHKDELSASARNQPSDEEKFLWNDIFRLMLESLERLPARQKEILLMRSQGYTNPEIAEKLNISLRTVETHYSKALANIRSIMGHENDGYVLLFFAVFF